MDTLFRINKTDLDQKVMECLSSQLCTDLGIVTSEDFDRAKQDKRNFGPISVNHVTPNKDSCVVKRVIIPKFEVITFSK